MRNDRDITVYELLMKVFRDNAYASIALNDALSDCKAEDKPYITKLFYGVLERNIYYDYAIEKFASSKPKKPIAVIVKMGYYLLENMRVPSYAAVNNMVSLCGKVGKSGASGFVNSALRKFKPPELPQEGTLERLSVEYGYPLWLCEMLVNDYGYTFVRDMLAHAPEKRTHIRVNNAVISEKKFAEKYADFISDGDDPSLSPSRVGYYATRKFIESANSGDYVVQSAASIAAVKAYLHNLPNVKLALDTCAAPGGKAVLTASISGAQVVACDVHKHRVELIRKYAFHCDTRICALVQDATVYNPEWRNKYDLVICDVPCSGIGVAGSKPDILYNRGKEDIAELAALQKKILETASAYVKKSGRLCYSTCTVLKCENGDIIKDFLSRHHEFERDMIESPYTHGESSEINLFPHLHNTDGFFVAAMRKRA